MKYELAEAILTEAMRHWDINKKVDETRDIQIISELKYDDYQQFTHGMRYIESLALWLRQFKSAADKDLAYDLIKNNLIFISVEEMRQLVTNSYPLIMHQFIMDKTRKFCKTEGVTDITDRKAIYRYFKRCSLFLGLSDGAHIDFFRRQNADLSNEQIFVHYDLSESKSNDMQEDLKKDLDKLSICLKYTKLKNCNFSSYFLLDDFSGSGKSYIRKDEKGWHGKIYRFYDSLEKIGVNIENIEVHLILYVSTKKSIDYIKNIIEGLRADKKLQGIFTVDAVQMVQAIDWDNFIELKQLLQENYDGYIALGYKSFEDKHFHVGNGKEPYLGFADCSLPLVLYHNTPNNSLPVLWYTWCNRVDALFMRITRHKENLV